MLYRIQIVLNHVLFLLDTSFPQKSRFRIEKVVFAVYLTLRDGETGARHVLARHLFMRRIQLFSEREEARLLVFTVRLLRCAYLSELAHVASRHQKDFVDVLLLCLVVFVASFRFNRRGYTVTSTVRTLGLEVTPVEDRPAEVGVETGVALMCGATTSLLLRLEARDSRLWKAFLNSYATVAPITRTCGQGFSHGLV